jgi:hypothetical protein
MRSLAKRSTRLAVTGTTEPGAQTAHDPAHIAGVSKRRYVVATSRCPDWGHDLQDTCGKT